MSGTVYLSGPVTGTTYKAARYGWRKEFTEMLDKGITVLSPMRHEGHLAEVQGTLEKSYPENLFSRPKMIVAKDFLDVSVSDIVIVHLLGATRISVGTMVELGYAKALGKTIVTIMEKGNLHEHPFVIEVSDTVVGSLAEASAIINSLLSEGI